MLELYGKGTWRTARRLMAAEFSWRDPLEALSLGVRHRAQRSSTTATYLRPRLAAVLVAVRLPAALRMSRLCGGQRSSCCAAAQLLLRRRRCSDLSAFLGDRHPLEFGSAQWPLLGLNFVSKF